MDKEIINCRLLLVDDEDDFRRTTAAILSRRGFGVEQAAGGEEALALIAQRCPDIVILDLKMPHMSGIETLQKIREISASLPVIILTGHGDYDAAVAGINLDVVDFLQKPVDINQLATSIRAFLDQKERKPLRERTIAEIMIQPSFYPRVYVDQTAVAVLGALKKAFHQPAPEGMKPGQVRSALVYGRNDKFLGIIRFNDLLKLLLPAFLRESPYTTYFTGMFLAQCKVFGSTSIEELLSEQFFIDVDAPLMEAVHLMAKHEKINLPVLKDGELVGILRGRDIVLEIANNLGVI